MDWPSFGWGMFAATCALLAVEWALYHFAPESKSKRKSKAMQLPERWKVEKRCERS